MKILIIINSLTPGGAERQAVQDANLLSAAGNEITVCFGVDGPLKNQLNSKIQLLNFHTKSQFKAVLLVIKAIQQNNVELVLSHMFWANKVAAVAGFFTRRKVIIFEHGLGLWRKWHHMLLVKLVAKKVFKIITCSEAGRKIRINRENVSSKKVKVIHNSFYTPSQSNKNIIAPFKLKDSLFTIGYAGRFNKVKQLHILIEISLMLKKKFDDFQFVLLGDGKEKSFIETLIQENDLGDHFVLPGYVSNPLSYLKTMDCFVLPSKREDFSLALIEASSIGLPCLSFDVGGNKEIIKDGKTGFIIPPFDIEMMAEKILYLTQHDDIRDKMGNEAQKFVAANFSGIKRFERLNLLINEII